MDEVKAKDYLAAWNDLISLLLLAFAILVAGIEPHRRVWGRSIFHHILVIFAISINVIFSTARLIFEGALVATGPREFLLASVAYCARWIWLYVGITRSGSRSRKAFQVASHLKHLKTIRLTKSTRKPSLALETEPRGVWEGLKAVFSRITTCGRSSTKHVKENSDGRDGETELVIRSGERNSPPGVFYWRGVETVVKGLRSPFNEGVTYYVRLVERELHADHLNVIGTCDYKTKLEVEGTDVLYKKIFDLVLTCDSDSSEFNVDYSSFLRKFGGIAANTTPAVRNGATLESDLGDVARRLAADACYYISHNRTDFRTRDHVSYVNKCIEQTANAYFGLNPDNSPLGDASSAPSNDNCDL